MKTDHNSIIRNLSEISQKLARLIDETEKIKEFSNQSLKNWQSICFAVNSELKKNVVRIAVIGSIKSGKSTFVNSLFGKDYLRRGAGVITSMVTRVRNGPQDQATLFLKSWRKINHEINQALSFVPSLNELFQKDKLDIRLEKNRTDLKVALANLQYNQLISNYAFNKNIILISSYLNGYNEIRQCINEKSKIVKLNKNQLLSHQDFVSNDNLAVYMKDILIEVEGNDLGNNIEIADCQGSDSLNPIHLSMIQEYLNISHLIVYVISSRVGIRQADIKLLSMIKNMGISNNIIFIVNSDLNEHESVKSLKEFTTNVKKDLSSIYHFPFQIFTISALYSLIESSSPSKKREHLFQKNRKMEMLIFVKHEYGLFKKAFNEKIDRDRYLLLTANPIKKIISIIKIMKNWIKFNQKILKNKFLNSKDLLLNVNNSQAELMQTRMIVENSIEGTIERIKKELFLDVEEFFGNSRKGLVSNITEFIDKWNNIDYIDLKRETEKDILDSIPSFFLNFKKALEKHIVEKINPSIFHFIQKQELKLLRHLEHMSSTYSSLYRNAIERYNTKVGKFNLKLESTELSFNVPTSSASFKKHRKLYPLIFDSIQLPTKIKTKALFSFGLGKIIWHLPKMFNITETYKKYVRKKILRSAILQIKKETELSMLFYFKNYRENIKFQHIAHMADFFIDKFKQQITDHLNSGTMTSLELELLAKANDQKKEELLKILEHLEKKLDNIKSEIAELTYNNELDK